MFSKIAKIRIFANYFLPRFVMKFPEYKNLDLPAVQEKIVELWNDHSTFGRSIDQRSDTPASFFFEGLPSANGIPGIHDVIARTSKDVICSYKIPRGFPVERRAGWDTHGLPVELSEETMLG